MEKTIRLIIVEDNYAERLAEIFRGVEEFSNLEIVTATNLEEANTLLSESDKSSTVVFTDMMFPDKAESTDTEEAIKIFREICDGYGVNLENLDSFAEIIRPILKHLYKESAKTRELVLQTIGQKLTHDELMSESEFLEVAEPLKSLLKDFEELRDSTNSEIIEIGRSFQEKNLFSALKGVRTEYRFSAQGDPTWDFGVSLPTGFIGGKSQGTPMGIRVFQKSFKLGIPCVIITGDHAATPLPIIAAYLRDFGLAQSAKAVTAWDVLNQDGTLKVGGETTVDQTDFFVANKGYSGPYGYDSTQQWTDKLLVQIVRSLIKRLEH